MNANAGGGDPEARIPLTALPKLLPAQGNGKKPHQSTVFRWATRGVRGVVLRTEKIGNTRFTREAWLREFIDRLSHRPGDHVAAPTVDAGVEAKLDELGL